MGAGANTVVFVFSRGNPGRHFAPPVPSVLMFVGGFFLHISPTGGACTHFHLSPSGGSTPTFPCYRLHWTRVPVVPSHLAASDPQRYLWGCGGGVRVIEAPWPHFTIIHQGTRRCMQHEPLNLRRQSAFS